MKVKPFILRSKSSSLLRTSRMFMDLVNWSGSPKYRGFHDAFEMGFPVAGK
jgi:hypothetical protein